MRNGLIFAGFMAAASLSWACSVSSNSSQALSSSNNPPNSVTNVQTGTFAQPPNNKETVDLPAGAHPILRWEPAAEDSQIASAINASGQMYETRIFKRHPQLVKVDSTWIDAKQKALKIVLRNGQVKDVTTDKIVNLKQATAAQLLELVGIQPAQPERNKTGAKQAK